jgi:F0F1-type ATP synthase assembly protein I
MATEIIGTILFFSTMMVFIVSYFKTRHNERMALINSGRTAKIFDTNDTESNKSLKFGLFLLSIGLGLLTGLIIDNILDTEPAGVFVSILIFGGVSLIFYHIYVEGKAKKSTPKTMEDEMV